MEAPPGLPPGPRMSRAIQTAIWARQAQWLLAQSRRRLGRMFTLEIAYEGRWVVVSEPELVKQVFTGDPTATIQETLRLRPVIVIVIRKLTEAVELGGYELPAGVGVVPSIHLVHRDPTIYPEPERFLPERFLEAPPGTYTWIPFGGGMRRCLGAAFAQQEMAIVLRELVARRTVRPADAADERSFRRAVTETPRRNAEVVLG